MNEDKKLEDLMQLHLVPPAKPGLADNIISASIQIKQKQSLFKYIKQLLTEFHLPSPAYVFASFVVIGFIIGFAGFSETYNYYTDLNVFEQLLEDDGML